MGWLKEAQAGKLPDFHPLAGFVRIAFTHAFHHLIGETPYSQAIATVLAGGGDTDTNACIVGGLVGALHGISGIPEVMTQAVLHCDPTQGRPRPDWLHTSAAIEMADRLLCPSV